MCPFAAVLAQEAATPTPSPSPIAESTPASENAPVADASPTVAASPVATAVPEVASGASTGGGDVAPPTTTPSPAAASDLPPAPETASPSPTPSPSASPDTIPLDDKTAAEQPTPPPATAAASPTTAPPASGAPLDTENLAPALPESSAPTDKAMPDAAFTDPNAIIPDQPPLPPGIAQTAENEQDKERKLNILYHQVRVQAEKDPAIIAMLDRSTKAPTDEDRRAAMREYYRLLFKKIVTLDKTLDVKCEKMESAYLRRLSQQRMEPTIPLNPPPTPEPLHN